MSAVEYEEETRTYRYSYLLETRFSPPVGFQFFKVRVQPLDTPHQLTMSREVTALPPCQMRTVHDVWGNVVQYGGYEALHDHFFLVSQGTVCCREYRISDVSPSPLYTTFGPLTQPDDKFREVLREWREEFCEEGSLATPATYTLLQRRRLALAMMHLTYRQLHYERGVTDCRSTAAYALAQGRGVCQDYAHVMIVLCRMMGLSARYACGLVIGEGETHAWVEVHDGLCWHAYDPTRDRQIQWDYLLIAHGRDASDCPLNRGHLYQCTQERLLVSARVEVIDNS